MKIVLDTNVLISGIFFSGPPYQILKAWQENKFQIAVSGDILTEYHRVAEELSSKFPTVNIDKILELFTIYGKMVDVTGFDVLICEDPDDNMFISCALSSNSKIIVSGDKHLLKISGYEDIKVLTPRSFLDKYLI